MSPYRVSPQNFTLSPQNFNWWSRATDSFGASLRATVTTVTTKSERVYYSFL